MKANILITAFKSVRDKIGTTIGLTYALNQIKNGDQRAQIERLRELKGEQYKQAKAQLAVHYFTGQFIGGQGVKNLKSPSGLMILDFDGYPGDKELKSDRANLQADKYCLACWVSPSGKGLKMLVRIPETTDNDTYKAHFNAIQEYYKNSFFDTVTSDIARACFVSFDPELFTNYNAEIWTDKAEKAKLIPQPDRVSRQSQLSTNEVFNKLVNERECKDLNWSSGHWNAAVYALAVRCNDYNISQSEAQALIWSYANVDGTGYNNAMTTIKSAYKQPSANKSYNNPRVQSKAVKRAQSSTKPVKSVVDMLCKDDALIYNIVSDLGIYKNELTQKVEYRNGIELIDSDVAQITLKARGVSKGISDSDTMRVLHGNIIPSYHPFYAYLEYIANLPLKPGTVDNFISCLKLDNHHPEYLQRIVKKWFGGLMGTLYGNYSVMTLVFVGAQGNGKTTFFRNLLPDALSKYFAESDIKDDKDVCARMCSNLILYNDEFTSKNKTEASEFKKMSSADKFTYRKPYGRMDITNKRIACLCGSANESDVISDHTGNRRIIPVRLRHIDRETLEKIHIDDFYRELLDMHKADPVWWYLSPEDIKLMNDDTVQNTAVDEDEERVSKWTALDPLGHVSATEVAAHIADRDRAYRPNIHKLGRALNKVRGSSAQKRIGTQNIRGYKIRLVDKVAGCNTVTDMPF